MYIDEINLYATAQSEPLPVDHEYSWSTQGALDAAAVRRVGYVLEVGRSVRTAGGTGHIVSPRAQLVIIYYYYYYSVNCRLTVQDRDQSRNLRSMGLPYLHLY